MSTFHLTVSTPDGERFSGPAVSLSVRGVEGELAILAGHVPFATSLVPSTCLIEQEDGTVTEAEIQGGLLSVSPTHTTLLCGSFKLLS